jgi:hypothetical protein
LPSPFHNKPNVQFGTQAQSKKPEQTQCSIWYPSAKQKTKGSQAQSKKQEGEALTSALS